MTLEQFFFTATAISGIVLFVININVQNIKRTVNRWAREIIETGKTDQPETSEVATIYSNPFNDWYLDVDTDHRLQILRNAKIRAKIREYGKYRNYVTCYC